MVAIAIMEMLKMAVVTIAPEKLGRVRWGTTNQLAAPTGSKFTSSKGNATR